MTHPSRRSAAALTTASVVSFSLTLLGASLAILSGAAPIRALGLTDTADLGALLFVAPVLALILGLIVEAARIALRDGPLPEARPKQIIVWSGDTRQY